MPFLRAKCWDFLRGSVVKIPHFKCRGCRYYPFFEEPKSHKLGSAAKKRGKAELRKKKYLKICHNINFEKVGDTWKTF